MLNQLGRLTVPTFVALAILSLLAVPMLAGEFKGSFFTFTYSDSFVAQPDVDDFNVLHLEPASGEGVPWVKIYERRAPASTPIRKIVATLIIQMHRGKRPELIASSGHGAIAEWNQGEVRMASLVFTKNQAGRVVILMVTTTQAEWSRQNDRIQGMVGDLKVAGRAMVWQAQVKFSTSESAAKRKRWRGKHEFNVLRNISYDNFPEAKLDLYVPQGVENFPTLVWIHGGSLNGGDKGRGSNSNITKFFASMGFGVASLNYRLSPPVKFPVFNQDVAAGFAWVHNNVARYGGNPKKLILMGASAGGYLAASLTLNREYLAVHNLSPQDHIRAAILISGLYDVHNLASGGRRLATQFGTSEEVIGKASPITYASQDAPQILFLFADEDGEGRGEMTYALARALEDRGHTTHSVYEIADRTHTSMGTRFAELGDRVSELCLEFLRSLKY